MKKYINQQDMKQANAADVFSLIRENKDMTRKKIEYMTELSWGAVSNITARLLENKYILEYKPEESTGAGRTPFYLEVNGNDHFVLGLDINSSGFKGVIINLKNEIIKTFSQEVEYTSKERLLHDIAVFAKNVVAEAKEKHILSIGIAMQGTVNSQCGISVHLPHCDDWENVELCKYLEETLGFPVFIEHDPNCILYAVSKQIEDDDTILVRVDNGIGMAVMTDGEINDRPGTFEIGHITVDKKGIPCRCGKKDCLEVYASRRGIERLSGEKFKTIAEKARNGGAELEYFKDMAEYLAVSIANTAKLLNIKNIVICGDMKDYSDLFYDDLMENAKKHFAELRFSISEEENAAYGAALIAVERSMVLL